MKAWNFFEIAPGLPRPRYLSRGRRKTRADALVTFVLWLLIASLILAAVAMRSPPANGFQTGGQFAATVIGQPNFTSRSVSLSPNSLNQPFRPAFDSSGNLWVADEGNHRVVEFRPPFTDGEAASIEIGQGNFTAVGAENIVSQSSLLAPVAVAFDHSGDLWVSDFVSSRVTEYQPPFTNGMNASLELGQPGGKTQFVSHGARPPDSGLAAPLDIAFDASGDLWVADRGNNRVVEYVQPFTSGKSPSVVIGQPSLDSNATGTTQSSLNGPESITFDASGDLWVADENNNRILEFPASSLKTDGAPAILEIGQTPGPDQFLTGYSGTSQGALKAPVGIAFDPSGVLIVADRANNRVLGFKPPFVNGMGASFEIGQPEGPDQFTTAIAGLAQNMLNNTLGVAFDPSGDLWVADQRNARVLEFSGTASVTTASEVAASGGTAGVDETSTGIGITVTGLSPGSVVNVYSAALTAQPSNTGSPGLANPVAFYHAKVSGQSKGTSILCVSDSKASSSTTIAFYDGEKWAMAGGTNRTVGGSVCGSIPLSTMNSLTLLAVGDGTVAAPSFPTLQVTALVLAAALFCVTVYVAARRRRRR